MKCNCQSNIYKIFKFEFYKLLLAYKKTQKVFLDKYKSHELSGFIQTKKDIQYSIAFA